jgi:hypothetical protein
MGQVRTRDEIATVPPATMLFSSNTRSGVSAASPAVPWQIVFASLSLIRKWPASPEASADVSELIDANVTAPEDAAPVAGSEQVSVARSVPESASLTFVGGAPVRMVIVAAPAPASNRARSPLAAALRADVLILKLLAISAALLSQEMVNVSPDWGMVVRPVNVNAPPDVEAVMSVFWPLRAAVVVFLSKARICPLY